VNPDVLFLCYISLYIHPKNSIGSLLLLWLNKKYVPVNPCIIRTTQMRAMGEPQLHVPREVAETQSSTRELCVVLFRATAV
jgi:hypothetical protein